MKPTIRFFMLFVIISVLAACKDDSGQPVTTEIEGAWEICVLFEDNSSKTRELIFVDNTYQILDKSYSDDACQVSDEASATESGVFTIGNSLTTSQGLRAIEIDFMTLKVNDSSVSEIEYDIYSLTDEGKLIFGNVASGDGSTIESRPTELDFRFSFDRKDLDSSGDGSVDTEERKENHAVAPEGLKELRVKNLRGTARIPNVGVIALFEDGTYRRESISSLFSNPDYLENSKLNQPHLWGEWRQRGETLELNSSGGGFISGERWTASAPGSTDQKLDGCYRWWFSPDVPNFGFVINRVIEWCFYPNGEFYRKETSSTSNAKVILGEYRIDGYSMRLDYEDFVSRDGIYELSDTRAFGFYERDFITINNKGFILDLPT